MHLRGAATSFLLISGCGLVSGLDGLGVSDGSIDATANDTGTSDTGTSDVTLPNDGGTTGDAPILFESGPAPNFGIHCGPLKTCTGTTHCCASLASQPNCTNNDCVDGSIRLNCDDFSDCNPNEVCCFANGLAQCQSGSTCANELCSSFQCPNSGICTAFDAGDGLALSRCQ